MSKKYFIVADVHGFYDEMIKALDGAGFDINNPMHIFVSLGDLLDRGPDPIKCLEFVNSLPEDRKILIKGNHEDLMEEMIARRKSNQHDWHNGTIQTALDLAGYGLTSFVESDVFDAMRKHPDYNEYINSTVDYYEDDKHIFVHGWIPCKSNDSNMYHARGIKYTFDENWRNGDWKYARWINGADAWNQGVRVGGKTIYCGHWHCSWPRAHIDHTGVEFDNEYSINPSHRKADFSPWYNDGICCIDSCCAYSHKINCVVIEQE